MLDKLKEWQAIVIILIITVIYAPLGSLLAILWIMNSFHN